MIDVSSSVVIDGAGAHEAADADVPEAGAAVERRADHGVVEPRLRGGDARLVGFQRCLDLLEIRDIDSAWRDCRSRLRSYWLLLRASDAWASASEARACDGVHLDEHLAALDFLAFLEADRGDRVRRLRRDLDGLVGPGRADGLDLDAHRLDACGLRDDGDAAAGAAAARASGAESVHADDSSASAQTAVSRAPAVLFRETVVRGCPRSLHDMRRWVSRALGERSIYSTRSSPRLLAPWAHPIPNGPRKKTLD